MENRFDIILISWNRLSYLQRTIASLIASNAINDCERFIIVDNGSTEAGVREFLEDLRKEYRAFIISCPENRGWGTAVNIGIGLSRAPFLFLSNNDVEYIVDFHKRMFESFEHQSNIGLLGVWKHTSHSFVKNGVMNNWFRETDDVPGVGWMLFKGVMEEVGMIYERGVCLTKGGNGEDSNYVERMKEAGYLTGVPATDLATHIDGY